MKGGGIKKMDRKVTENGGKADISVNNKNVHITGNCLITPQKTRKIKKKENNCKAQLQEKTGKC